MIMKKILMIVMAALSSIVFSQELTITSGNFDFLNNQTDVNVELKIGGATYQEKNYTEEQYLEIRQKDITERKGENVWNNWINQWQKFKETEYLNYFLKGINSKSKKVIFKDHVKTKYTLVIDTKWLYAGWYAGFVGYQPGKVSANLSFIETDDPAKVLITLDAEKVKGKKSNDQFTWEYGRITAAYEVLGKELGKEIKGALK